jgi:hypothetical protein
MKVDIKLKAVHIAYLDACFSSYCDAYKEMFPRLSRKEKAAFTIALDVSDRLSIKARNLSRKPDNKKLHKMTFKYHEAHAINFYVFKTKDTEPDVYFRAIAQTIYNELDQKLN